MRNKLKYKIPLLILGIVLVVGGATAIRMLWIKGHTETVARLSETDTLVIVTNYSPFGYFVRGDSIVGANNDLIKLFQSYTKFVLKVELESSLEKSIEGLYNKKYDIVARGIPITSELKDKVLFSKPVTRTKQVLVQRKQSYNNSIPPLRSHLELAGKTLYVSKGSPAILRIKNLSHEIGDTVYYEEDEVYGDEQLAIMVAEKEIDFAVCDQKIAQAIIDMYPELDLETKIGFTQLEAWAVGHDQNELLDTLNSWIDRAVEMKKINKILKNYLD